MYALGVKRTSVHVKVRSVPEGGINEILACPADAERMTRIMKGSGMVGASAISLCRVLQQFGVLVVGRPSLLDAASGKYGPPVHPGRDRYSLTR